MTPRRLSLFITSIVLLVVSSVSSGQQPTLSLFSSLGGHDWSGSVQASQVRQTPVSNTNPLASLRNRTVLDRKCLMCKFSVSLVNYALKTKRGQDQIDRIANNFCVSAHLEAPLVCSKISKLFNSEVTKVLTYGVVTPDQVCGLLSNNTCGHFHSPLDDWEINLEASSFVNQSELELLRQQRSIIFNNQTSSDSYRVIHISDTHVDLNYAAGSAAKCEEPLCCQVTSTPLNKTVDPAQEKAGYWGTYGHCDIPLRTFVATLKHLNETLSNSNDISYIIWTGDIQPHDVWAQSKQSAVQIYDSVFKRIIKYLPNSIILPTFGNHEMIPVDSFSPSNLLAIAKEDSPVWLYQMFDAYWARWLPKETEATITKDGFYAATVRPGLKVISLNTNFCHSRNFWLFINSTDPGNQLQWLVHELQLSELSHEKVHIIGHIPPGAEDCMRVWSKNYHKILIRYASTITGQFFGHTHTSEFEMFYAEQNRNMSKRQNADVQNDATSLTSQNLKPISVAQIGPSITTFVDLNPSYRIYTIDPKRDFQPIDYETFYVNLTRANELGKNSKPEWISAGLFSKKFGLTDITPESMHKLMLNIASNLRVSEVLNVTSEDLPLGFDDSNEVDNNEEDVDDNDDDDTSQDDEQDKASNQSNTTTEKPRATSRARSLGQEDLLFELYRLFSSYSDNYTREFYDKTSLEDKKKFVCRMLTGQAHNPWACKQMIPTIDLPKLNV